MLIPCENNMIELGSSDEYDSDRIDSDVEAELYSSLHHEVIPVDAMNSVSPSNKMSSNKDESMDEIIIISEDESDDDVIPINVSNASKVQPFYIDNKGASHTSFESPPKKKCKVTNLAVESGSADSKRKSDVVANLIENIQVQKQPKKRRRRSKNKLNESNCSSREMTIEISDSDSYQDLSDLDESGIQYVHTNISSEGNQSGLNDSVTCLGAKEKKQRQIADTISLNSDSEDDSFKFEFSFDSSNSSFGSSSQDLWRINDTDLYRTKRKSAGGRYHEDAVAQCTNCNQKGHTARYCLEPKVFKCPICGGAHSHFKCKQKMCEKCFRFGHGGKYCLLPVDQFVCSICNMRGHLNKVCPDLWRRYHLTTSGEQIRRAKKSHQVGPIYCFNCGEQDHFGFQCGRRRIENSYPTLPAVISYQHPLESLQMYTPQMFPNLPPAQMLCSPMPPSPLTLPLCEVNQTEGGSAPLSNKAKKKLKNVMRRKKEELKKRVERRMNPLVQTVPQYTPKMTKLHRNDPRRPTEDILSEIREKIKNTPPENRNIKKRLKRKIRIVKLMERKKRRKGKDKEKVAAAAAV